MPFGFTSPANVVTFAAPEGVMSISELSLRVATTRDMTLLALPVILIVPLFPKLLAK
ncbi:hypothetical protein D3C73_1660490 [compost metagenome]